MLTTPGLDDGHAFHRVYLKHAVEAGHGHEDAAVYRDGAAAEACARAAGHDGNTVAAGDRHHLSSLRGAAGHRDDAGERALHRAVVLVDQQLLRPRQHVAAADRPLKLPDQGIHSPVSFHAGGRPALGENAHSIAGRPCGGKETEGRRQREQPGGPCIRWCIVGGLNVQSQVNGGRAMPRPTMLIAAVLVSTACRGSVRRRGGGGVPGGHRA